MYVQDDEPNDEGPGTEDEDEDNTDVDMDDDDASFASVDELDSAPLERIFLSPFAHDLNYVDEGAAHMLELSKLAEKDPEFYKYLEEHDRNPLEFNVDDDDDVEDADDDDDAGEPDATQLPTLTENKLRSWQKSLLEVGKPAKLAWTSRVNACSLDKIPACFAQAPGRISLRRLHE